MTLDEAIKNAEDVANEWRNVDMAELDLMYVGDTECIEAHKNRNIECAEEFEQLAKWLRELKQLREQEPILDKIRREIEKERVNADWDFGQEIYYNNAIDNVLQIIDKYRQENQYDKRSR